MIQLTKTFKIKGNYNITKQFTSIEELMNELELYGYEGEYDETNQEFIDALNEYFDEPIKTSTNIGMFGFDSVDNLEVDFDNFSTHYTLKGVEHEDLPF